MQFNTAVQHTAIQYNINNAMQDHYHTTQYNAMQCNCNPMQYTTKEKHIRRDYTSAKMLGVVSSTKIRIKLILMMESVGSLQWYM